MTVTILRHHEGHNPNDKVDVDKDIAMYWIAVGVATIEEADNKYIDAVLNDQLKKIKKKKK